MAFDELRLSAATLRHRSVTSPLSRRAIGTRA
jgi:hypothetical protein